MKRMRTLGAAVTTAALLRSPSGLRPRRPPTRPATDPTFKEFKESTFRDVDGQFIVNGDEPAGNQATCASPTTAMVGPSTARTLIVNTGRRRRRQVERRAGAQPDLLREHEVRLDYAAVVNAMTGGAALWEGASSKVNFTYVLEPGRATAPRATTACCSRSSRPTPRSTSPGRSSRAAPKQPRNVLVNADSLSELRAPGRRATSSATSSATRWASGTSTPGPSPAPASRTTTGVR